MNQPAHEPEKNPFLNVSISTPQNYKDEISSNSPAKPCIHNVKQGDFCIIVSTSGAARPYVIYIDSFPNGHVQYFNPLKDVPHSVLPIHEFEQEPGGRKPSHRLMRVFTFEDIKNGESIFCTATLPLAKTDEHREKNKGVLKMLQSYQNRFPELIVKHDLPITTLIEQYRIAVESHSM